MHFSFQPYLRSLVLLAGLALHLFASVADAAGPSAIDEDVSAALRALYAEEPGTEALAAHAKAILVFPNITKAGFVVGAQYGNGVIIQNGAVTGHYNISAVSYGLQAGLQSFGYVMFVMGDQALNDFLHSAGFEVGVGPSVVVIDKGMSHSVTTTTIKSGIYTAVFGQKGLMAGASLQGAKITRLKD